MPSVRAGVSAVVELFLLPIECIVFPSLGSLTHPILSLSQPFLSAFFS
ncbi:MAG: hypothetical protein SOY22_15550 [Terrisporobacter sp.]|nr:hypothetical protein [Terrisporobacter sp.]